MAMRSPVRGFAPSRAGRSVRTNLPNFATVTSSRRASASAMGLEHSSDRALRRLLPSARLAGNQFDGLPPVHSFASLVTPPRLTRPNPEAESRT